jgi:putative endonuclease
MAKTSNDAQNNAQNTKIAGNFGEALAEHELLKIGFNIIAKNYRSPFGEVDLIGTEFYEDRHTLVFVEVKSWKTLSIGSLEQSISKKKQQRIIETAKYFIKTNREYRSMIVRFDLVFIGQEGFRHIRSAWTENT